MQRMVVWINGSPLLLGDGESATEENINKARAKMGLPPLNKQDEINGVEIIYMRGKVVGNVELKYPERSA